MFHQRRTAAEANPSGADGPGIPVSAPHGSHYDRTGREEIMGQKTHPYGFRLGITKPWRSRWFAKRDYSRLLHEDLKLKRDLKKQLAHAGVSNIEVERMANKLRITIYTSRPGIIIGRKGAEIDKLKADIQKRTNREVYINIQEIHRPELDSQLVAESIAMQLEKQIGRASCRERVEITEE